MPFPESVLCTRYLCDALHALKRSAAAFPGGGSLGGLDYVVAGLPD